MGIFPAIHLPAHSASGRGGALRGQSMHRAGAQLPWELGPWSSGLFVPESPSLSGEPGPLLPPPCGSGCDETPKTHFLKTLVSPTPVLGTKELRLSGSLTLEGT